jgi:hypothetical protein
MSCYEPEIKKPISVAEKEENKERREKRKKK